MDLLGSSQVILLPPKNAPKMASATVLDIDYTPATVVHRSKRCPSQYSKLVTRNIDTNLFKITLNKSRLWQWLVDFDQIPVWVTDVSTANAPIRVVRWTNGQWNALRF